MKIDVLIEILEKIRSSSNGKIVEIYADGNEPGYYIITSVSSTSDGHVIINASKD